MRQLFEVFTSSHGEWLSSSLIMRHRQSSKSVCSGRFAWRTWSAIAAEHLAKLDSIGLHVFFICLLIYIYMSWQTIAAEHLAKLDSQFSIGLHVLICF